MEPAMEEFNTSIELARSMGSGFEEARPLKQHAGIMLEHKGGMMKAIASLARAEGVFSDIGAARELGYTKVLKARLAELPE